MKRISAFATLVLLIICGDSDPKPGTPVPGSFHSQTPAGISVRIEDGLPADSNLHLRLDQEATRVFNRMDELGKVGYPTYRGISVRIVSRRPECEEPACCFIEESCERVSNCEVYDGGVYDKDKERNGRIKLCAAGQFIPQEDTILVSRDGLLAGDDFGNEVEHWVLYHFDRDWYLRTRDHYGLDSAHPILRAVKGVNPLNANKR